MLYDKAKIHIKAGAGGNGTVSFRREAHVPKGGPDGGDGGRGGDVVLVCDDSKRDLAHLRRGRHFKASRGGHGEGSRRHGADGQDAAIPVPPGTQVVGLGGATFDLVEPGQRVTLARGGSGGRGNRQFASSTRQAPRMAERGLTGEEGWVELRLKLLADAGLVGLPNAGKSSLLARLTRAAPKVADYPFTTIEPVLGTLEGEERQLVLADIPGLIEGAAGGAGLGHEFLAHVERCRMLIHIVEPDVEDAESVTAYETVRAELGLYGHGLDALPELVVLSKSDLLPPEEVEARLAAWRGRLGESAIDVLAASSATGAGLDELRQRIFAAHAALEHTSVPRPAPEFAAEHRTYRPGQDRGFRVSRVGEGAYLIEGPGIERLVQRHDLANEEALAYIESRLHALGVVKALEDAGFEPGNEIQIGDAAFDFYPG